MSHKKNKHAYKSVVQDNSRRVVHMWPEGMLSFDSILSERYGNKQLKVFQPLSVDAQGMHNQTRKKFKVSKLSLISNEEKHCLTALHSDSPNINVNFRQSSDLRHSYCNSALVPNFVIPKGNQLTNNNKSAVVIKVDSELLLKESSTQFIEEENSFILNSLKSKSKFNSSKDDINDAEWQVKHVIAGGSSPALSKEECKSPIIGSQQSASPILCKSTRRDPSRSKVFIAASRRQLFPRSKTVGYANTSHSVGHSSLREETAKKESLNSSANKSFSDTFTVTSPFHDSAEVHSALSGGSLFQVNDLNKRISSPDDYRKQSLFDKWSISSTVSENLNSVSQVNVADEEYIEDNSEDVISKNEDKLKSGSIESGSSMISVGKDSSLGDESAISEDSSHSPTASPQCTTFNVLDCSPVHIQQPFHIDECSPPTSPSPQNLCDASESDQSKSESDDNEKIHKEPISMISKEKFMSPSKNVTRNNCNNAIFSENGNPVTCREWILKLHKTPQKRKDSNSNEETPESAGRKYDRNGFAGRLQRALAVWDSRNAIRSYKSSALGDGIINPPPDLRTPNPINYPLNARISAAHSSTLSISCKSEKSLSCCPNLMCNNRANACNFSTKLLDNCDVEPIDVGKEMTVAIASHGTSHDPLPSNACVAFIIESPAAVATISTTSIEKSQEHQENKKKYQEHQENKSRQILCSNSANDCHLASILPCPHLVLLFFLQVMAKPPEIGSIFNIRPPWQQLYQKAHPKRVVFVSNCNKCG